MDKDVEMENLGITFSVGGEPIELSMTVPVPPVKLRRMLPVFQKMSTTFIENGMENIRASGKEISCRAGCGACCRQLVPISEAEAYDLRELVEQMPEPRKTEVIERFKAGVAKLTEAGVFERLEMAAYADDETDYDKLVREYFTFQVACPFLENESCSIHESRPISCREYLVTSPAELCSNAEGTGVENVRHYFQVKESVIMLARQKTAEELPYVPMIRLMEWTDEMPDDSPERTGKEWIGDFFNLLSRYSRPL